MVRPRHVVLLGAMGAGKSTVGRLLAARLGWALQDSDVTLAVRAERTAAELARDEGSVGLHAHEAAILLEQLAAEGPSVIAAAASVVEDPAAIAALTDAAILRVWLRASPEVLVERAVGGAHRPWHDHRPIDYLRERASVRDPVYRRLAGLVIDADDTPPDAAAAMIESTVRDQVSGA